MKPKLLAIPMWLLVPAVLLSFTSCSSTPPAPTVETTATSSYKHGVPGGVAVRTHTITANVTEIDLVNRKVTLFGPRGTLFLVKCGPQVVNLEQIRVGDQLKATMTEELAISMLTGSAPAGDSTPKSVTLASKGSRPGTVTAEARQVTATVTKIDLKRHKATLQFPDGSSRTVAVRPDIDLTQRKVGEQLVIRTTEVVAVSLEKP